MSAQQSQEVWSKDVASMERPQADWLWHGLIARGSMTLLTSMWKSGKTTLLSLLLSRRYTGGTLGGLAVKPGKSVVVSEEDTPLWAERLQQHAVGDDVCFFPRPFTGVPSAQDWQGLIARIEELHAQHGIDLVAIDPLAPLLPCENNARCIFDALLPLRALTRRGMAVLALHHPGKRRPRPGQAARGSSAMLGHVDISIEMRHPRGNLLTRRRRFLALSRHAETPRRLLLELNEAGSDYVPVAADPDDFQKSWDVLRLVFEEAPQKLTRQDVLLEWPPDFDKPSPATLRRWLDRAREHQLIAEEGTGRKTDPFRYWLPSREDHWRTINPLYDIDEKDRLFWKRPFQPLHGKRVNAEIQFPFELVGEATQGEKGMSEAEDGND